MMASGGTIITMISRFVAKATTFPAAPFGTRLAAAAVPMASAVNLGPLAHSIIRVPIRRRLGFGA